MLYLLFIMSAECSCTTFMSGSACYQFTTAADYQRLEAVAV